MSESNGNKGHYAYYPGCSAGASAKAYDMSALAVADVLGLKFQEVEDWNCCGSMEYFATDKLPAYSLVARNLALAAKQDAEDICAPCSACFLNLYKTDDHMGIDANLNNQVNRALAAGGLTYDPGSMKIRHLLDIMIEDVGYEEIAAHVSQPLKGLRVAPYYGCLIVRPYYKGNPEHPTHMDELLKALGATVVDFPMKAHCCGGHMSQISEDTSLELIRRILFNADEYKADVIATVCPMCQLNLDAYQSFVNRNHNTDFDLPVLYFTQLMGLAYGIDQKTLGFGTEIVSAKRALAKIGKVDDDDDKPKKRKRRDKKALPMPSAQ